MTIILRGQHLPPEYSIAVCVFIAFSYVGGLYIWNNNNDRNDPQTIKRRSASVFVVSLISPVFVYLLSSNELLTQVSFWNILGIRLDGILPAATIPLAVTFVLFLGPVVVKICKRDREDCEKIEFDIFLLRTLVIAPFCEEFTFRACMIPILLQSFSLLTSCIVSSLLFGIGHFHHIYFRLKSGFDLKPAIIVSFFQFTYTTIFGIYSAYLFASTGHFIAPLLAHSFCNFMGVPDIQELLENKGIKKKLLISCYFIGFFGWIYLIKTAFQPEIYRNTLFK